MRPLVSAVHALFVALAGCIGPRALRFAVGFPARAVSDRLISVGSSCLRCARPLLLRLQVALVRVPFDLDLLALCAIVRNVAACLAITHGSVLRGLDLLECAELRGAPRNPRILTKIRKFAALGTNL